jgi:hypothetical protein
MINAKLQNIIDTKSAIGNAINNKGGSITSETPFYEYAPAIENISTGGGAYSTFVAQAQDNSLYTVYNGYDATTNPTPNLSNNFAFNRWVLNNSATGSVVLSNVVVGSNGTFNGPNITTNQSNIAFVMDSPSYGATIRQIKINNEFVYMVGGRDVRKYHEGNLAFISETAGNYIGDIQAVAINNGFIYYGGSSSTGLNQTIIKLNESTFGFVSNSPSFGATIFSLAINNGHIYAGGFNNVAKYHESNLAFVGRTPSYGSTIFSITVNNGFIYAGGFNSTIGNIDVKKYHEGNLAFVGNTGAYGGIIRAITTNDGFLYVGGETNQTIRKYYESNLAFVANSPTYGSVIQTLTTNNGFIYAGGNGGLVQKFYESNLTRLVNSTTAGGTIFSIAINNGHFYAGGSSPIARKYQEFQSLPESISIFNITNIKE